MKVISGQLETPLTKKPLLARFQAVPKVCEPLTVGCELLMREGKP